MDTCDAALYAAQILQGHEEGCLVQWMVLYNQLLRQMDLFLSQLPMELLFVRVCDRGLFFLGNLGLGLEYVAWHRRVGPL